MKITDRNVTEEELNNIYKDFKNIEIEYSVPDAKADRYNITVEAKGKVIGFASGLTNHKWFCLTDLWIKDDYRNQKLGAKILKLLEDKVKSKGIKHIYTWTTGYNKNEEFYKKQGYEIFVIFEDFFEVKDGHHIGLKKDLN
jgi:N-acetylglutamate synthase-like GNAT family acetyltransferase